MNKNYQSDLDDTEPQDESQLWRYVTAVMLAVMFALSLLLASRAMAEDWQAPDLPCIPTVSDYDTYYRVEGKTFAIVWWCDLAEGLYTRWWTAQIGSASPGPADVLRLAGRDPWTFAQQAYSRESTPTELELVKQIEISQAPRCYVTGSGKNTAVLTSTSQHAISQPKRDGAGTTIYIPVGQRVACLSRLPKEPDKRYCEVSGSIDSKLRLIEGDAWAPCRIEKAPLDGW